MYQDICCIVCPSGCIIRVTGDENGRIEDVTGYSCSRGKEYAIGEFTAPKRILTTTVRAVGYAAPVISVRTSCAIPKEKMLPCMELLRGVVATAPFQVGRVLVSNVLGTGADVILTNGVFAPDA